MELKEKEKKKYDVIEQVINNKITRKEAQQILNLSAKQIGRLVKIYNTEGKEGFIHKSRGKISTKRKDPEIIEELKNLYLKEYFDYNFTAFYEEIEGKFDISYSKLHEAFTSDLIISPIAQKKTNNYYFTEMEKEISTKKENPSESKISDSRVELYKTRKLEQQKAFIRRSSNHFAFGEEVQLDACFSMWFGNIVSALHLAVDKATKKVLFGWFEYEELTRGYFVLLYNILINYGIPFKIKTDRRSTFSINREVKNITSDDSKKIKSANMTQFERICVELGIRLESTSNAVSKAHVERENGTFKNRLIAELRHEKITTIDEANEYLNITFIPKINKKFSYDIDDKKTMMRINDYSEEDLNLIISERFNRIIDNASAISYNGKYYVPVDKETGEIMTYKSKTICTVIIAYDSSLWCCIENNYYILNEIEKRKKIKKSENKTTKNNEEKIKVIPPKDHPWRKDMGKFFNKK